MQLHFDLPTLVTLTAPTCAGKSFLLEALVSELGFERIVSTTDRAPRVGEIDGVHYNFITTKQSKRLEDQGDLAELVTYNGVRYGVTHREMEAKMQTGRPPIVILEPKGLEIYHQYCTTKGWKMFSIYVQTPEHIRLERLANRTAAELASTVYSSDAFERLCEKFFKIVDRNNKRLMAVLQEERLWAHARRWDVLVDGTNLQKALENISAGVEWRNTRSDIYA